MRKVIAEQAGGPEVLQAVDASVPEAGPGEILIRSEAIGVNFADVWVRLGTEGTPPYSPGIEVAGTVIAAGQDVASPPIGARVAAIPYVGRAAYAEFVTAPAQHAFPVPDDMDSVTAAALPLNYLTAYAAVEHAARPRAGERLLVHAAAGGVGLASVQLARRHGVELYATASRSKHAALREEGVAFPIDYRSTDWVATIRELTGDGVDVVIDGVGEDAFRRSLEVTRFGGRVVAYGFTSGVPSATQRPADVEQALAGTIPLLDLLSDARSIMGVNIAAPAELLYGWWDDVVALYAEGELRPRIDRVLALEEAAEAHRRLHGRENTGKIVLVP